jgi:hypothetical protein
MFFGEKQFVAFTATNRARPNPPRQTEVIAEINRWRMHRERKVSHDMSDVATSCFTLVEIGRFYKQESIGLTIAEIVGFQCSKGF